MLASDESSLAIQWYLSRALSLPTPPPPPSPSLPPFPDRGVSLAFLRRFMAENKDRLRHAGAASTAHSSRLPETLTELVQRVNRLRAMPWESTELASVEAKLCAIKLSSVALFREALAKELQGDDFSGVPINKMLRDAGKTTFGAETKRIFAKVLQLEL